MIRSDENIGQNAYARAFRETTAPYLIELDDDVVDAPAGWDAMLLDAFVRLPRWASWPPTSRTTRTTRPRGGATRSAPHEYTAVGERRPPARRAGGRRLRDDLTESSTSASAASARGRTRCSGWRTRPTSRTSRRIGYGAAVLADLRVHHTGGSYYTVAPREKERYWKRHWARQARRTAAKRVLVRIPFVRRLNARNGWFVDPVRTVDPAQT